MVINEGIADDNVDDSVALDKNEQTKYLIFDNYDFSAVPDGDSITGFRVVMGRWVRDDEAWMRDWKLHLVRPDGTVPTTASGVEKTNLDIGGDEIDGDGWHPYHRGDSVNLWGEAPGYWTTAKIKDPDFGFAFAAQHYNAGGGFVYNLHVDYAKMKVYHRSSTLPITLTFFKAEIEDGVVRLTWSTSSETNNDYYTIERSVDAINFEEIIEMDGAGTSNVELEYETIDENPIEGYVYYRLRQTDYDGTKSVSRLVPVNYVDKDFPFELTPNPTTGMLMVATPEAVRVRMINGIGQQVGEFFVSNGDPIDISGYKSAIYYFEVYREGANKPVLWKKIMKK